MINLIVLIGKDIINYPFQEKLYKNEEFNSLEIIYLLNHKGKIIK